LQVEIWLEKQMVLFEKPREDNYMVYTLRN